MDFNKKIIISEFSDKYKEQTKQVVLTVLRSLGFKPDPKNSLRDDDLDNILKHYKNDGAFWIAILSNKVIGTVAIERKNEESAYLRRMFVLPEYHGMGVGKKLLETAVDFAKDKNYKKLYLTTHEVMKRAHHFYEKSGFKKNGKTTEGYSYFMQLS